MSDKHNKQITNRADIIGHLACQALNVSCVLTSVSLATFNTLVPFGGLIILWVLKKWGTLQVLMSWDKTGGRRDRWCVFKTGGYDGTTWSLYCLLSKMQIDTVVQCLTDVDSKYFLVLKATWSLTELLNSTNGGWKMLKAIYKWMGLAVIQENFIPPKLMAD